jgi:hypothetical protein
VLSVSLLRCAAGSSPRAIRGFRACNPWNDDRTLGNDAPWYVRDRMTARARERIDRTLALLRIEEVPACLRFVDLMELSGSMTTAEAAEWRPRILAWCFFLQLAADAAPSDAGLRPLDRRRRLGRVRVTGPTGQERRDLENTGHG